VIIRPATEEDASDVAAIYAHHVLGEGTFEEEAPDSEEMARRIASVIGSGLPYLVAEESGTVLGFAYAAPFRPRAAYRYTVENSVYVGADHLRRGVGRALLSAVLDACTKLGMRQVIAAVGDSGNAPSLALHRSLGFVDDGVSRSVGFKNGRWLDVVWLRKPLNGGDSTWPDGPGQDL